MSAYHTPGQVSALLDIPGSSLRRLVAQFADHLSEDAKRQRGRLFTDADVAVLAQVRELTLKGYKVSEIPAMLGEVVQDESPPEELPPVTALAVMRRLVDVSQSHDSQLNQMRDELAALRAEVEELRRPWWKKLRKG